MFTRSSLSLNCSMCSLLFSVSASDWRAKAVIDSRITMIPRWAFSAFICSAHVCGRAEAGGRRLEDGVSHRGFVKLVNDCRCEGEPGPRGAP